jgi:NAD(P)-dependent dehydrogenase (short-subunit alcohol dehydrogenase family)
VAHKSGLAIACTAHDVTSREDWEKVIEKTIGLYGKIDILINNAGIYPPGATTETTSPDLWNKVININLTGPFIGSQLCTVHMKNAGGGSIVNISSIAGLVGGNGAAYTASKGGLRLLTKDLAVELAKYHIRANSIHPGGIITPMTDFLLDSEASKEIIKNLCPMERMGNAMEVAFGALFLASDEASYITGAELVIDGGLTAR